jgi:uncharacterized protein (TIGR00251 family)
MIIKIASNAHNNSIEGFQEDSLKIKIKAPLDKGNANEKIIEFLSDTFRKKIEIQATLALTTFIKN